MEVEISTCELAIFNVFHIKLHMPPTTPTVPIRRAKPPAIRIKVPVTQRRGM
jgi:hypothetical protein